MSVVRTGFLPLHLLREMRISLSICFDLLLSCWLGLSWRNSTRTPHMLMFLPTAPPRHTHAFAHVTQPQLPVSLTGPSLFLHRSLYSPRTEMAHYAIISIKTSAGFLNRIRSIYSLSSAYTQPPPATVKSQAALSTPSHPLPHSHHLYPFLLNLFVAEVIPSACSFLFSGEFP